MILAILFIFGFLVTFGIPLALHYIQVHASREPIPHESFTRHTPARAVFVAEAE